MIPMNTWKRTPLTKNDKQRIKKAANTEEIIKTIKQEQQTTWISPGGKTKRQIDYIMINHRYRNNVTRAWVMTENRANMTQQRQHAVLLHDNNAQTPTEIP